MKGKNKILYVVTKSVWAGAGKYVYDLAINLPKDQFFVAVAAGGSGKLAEKIKKAGIEYFEIKNFQKSVNPLKDIAAIFEILKLINNFRPDVIHVNSSKAGGLVGVAAFFYKLFTFRFSLLNIFTAHGWAFNESRPKWQLFLIKFLSKLTVKFYNKIICVSEYDRNSALKYKIAATPKLVTIHNGINPEEYKFLPKEEARKQLSTMFQIPHMRNLKQEDFIIGTVGEFTKNKNQSLLIETVKIIMASGPDFVKDPRFVNRDYPLLAILIGWGEDEKKLKRKVKNEKLEDKIFIINNLAPVAPYLKAFDIFVLPSLKEGLPYVLLEAGLAELPVIASDIGGIPEIINNENTGKLYKEQKPEILADKISSLVNSQSQRENLGINLKDHILKNFNLEKMIEQTLKVYHL